MGRRSTKTSRNRPAKRKGAVRKTASRTASKPAPRSWRRLGSWLLILAFVTLPALVVAPGAEESFRLPKLFAYEILSLLSLLLLAWRLRSAERLDLAGLPRRPVVVAFLPLLLVAASGLVTSEHPLHVRQALPSLAIGAACLVGWSLALRPAELRRILAALLAPAVILSLIAIAQFHGWIELFRFQGFVKDRIAVTSLAGGVFDLAGFLVLPLLVAQVGLYRAPRRRRWLWAAALAVGLYALVLTQTLTAIAALVVGSFVLWLGLLPWRRVVAATALAALLAAGLGWGVGPLRQRLERKISSFGAGDLNQLLSGRLDGWWAAAWMFGQRPWAGVGHGAYRAEFGDARLALSEAGRRFYRRQHQTYFSNAHSEFLEVAAEWGIPGCLALGWALGCLLLRLRSRRRGDADDGDGEPPEEPAEAALMVAGVAALAALAAANFPWRVALIAYPQLIFLAWIFAPRRPPGDGDRPGGVRPSAAPHPGARRLAWVLAALLVAALVLEGRQAERRLRASHQLAAVEDMTRQLASRGLLTRQVMERQAHVMQEAAALDPVEVGIPIARGAQYVLLGRYDAAIRAYEEALELEARGEIYANLGRTRFHAGDREGAREAFTKALRLNPNLGRKFKSYVRELNVRGPGRLEEEEEPEEDPGLP